MYLFMSCRRTSYLKLSPLFTSPLLSTCCFSTHYCVISVTWSVSSEQLLLNAVQSVIKCASPDLFSVLQFGKPSRATTRPSSRARRRRCLPSVWPQWPPTSARVRARRRRGAEVGRTHAPHVVPPSSLWWFDPLQLLRSSMDISSV